MVFAQNGLSELISAGTPQTLEGRVLGTKNTQGGSDRAAARSLPP